MTVPILPIRSPEAIVQAIEFLKDGQLVIIPTDTIYGIAALPERQTIITRLYEVRQRALEPASPLLLSDSGQLTELARANRLARRLARYFWPGSLTMILPPGPYLNPVLSASPVALRVPNYPLLKPLLEAAGGYLFVSGAICCGASPAITAQEAADLFGDAVALILDGGLAPFGVPSTILDCTVRPPIIRRRGAVPEERVWKVLGMAPPSNNCE